MRDPFHARAIETFEAAKIFKDSFEDYRDPAGLLCLHAGISLNDAINSAVLVRKLRGDDHRQAVRALKECCDRKSIRGDRRQGVAHFRALIGLKHDFAYGHDRARMEEVRWAYDRMEKFFSWSYEQFARELKDASKAE